MKKPNAKMGRPKLAPEKTRVNLTITLPPELAKLAAHAAGSDNKDDKTAVRNGIMEILEEQLVHEKMVKVQSHETQGNQALVD